MNDTNMTSAPRHAMQGLHVREAINQGLTRAALAASKDSEAERIYQAGGTLSPKLSDLCGSAIDNYMAAVSCLLKVIPFLQGKDAKSGELVRSEVDKMLVRLEKVREIQNAAKIQGMAISTSSEGTDPKTIAATTNNKKVLETDSEIEPDSSLHRELEQEGIIARNGVDRPVSVQGLNDFPVGCSIYVDIDGVKVKGKICGRESARKYVVTTIPDGQWLEHVDVSRISLCLESNHNFQIDIPSLRQRVVEEIVSTERSYVESLSTLVEQYYKPMLYPAVWGGTKQTSMFTTTVLSRDQAKVVFGNLEEIYGTHKMFLSHLEQRIATWEPETSTVGDILAKFSPFFKNVTGYSNGFQEATQLVAKLTKESSPFQSVLEQAASRGAEELTSLMIKPIQRIPRYKLLLKELLKRTERSHPDYAQVTTALKVISEVATHINETLKKHENQVKAYTIGESFDPPIELAAPHREFKFQNQLTKFSSNLFKNFYTFWLFNDILVYGRPSLMKPNRYRLQRIVHVKYASPYPFEGGGPNSFVVHAEEKPIHLVAPNASVKRKWVKGIGTGAAASHAEVPATNPSRLRPTSVSHRSVANATTASAARSTSNGTVVGADSSVVHPPDIVLVKGDSELPVAVPVRLAHPGTSTRTADTKGSTVMNNSTSPSSSPPPKAPPSSVDYQPKVSEHPTNHSASNSVEVQSLDDKASTGLSSRQIDSFNAAAVASDHATGLISTTDTASQLVDSSNVAAASDHATGPISTTDTASQLVDFSNAAVVSDHATSEQTDSSNAGAILNHTSSERVESQKLNNSEQTDNTGASELENCSGEDDVDAMFPVSDDEGCGSPVPLATQFSQPATVKATALYDFVGVDGTEELSFSKGENLQIQLHPVTCTIVPEDGWVTIMNDEGKKGYGPLSYLQYLENK